MFYNESLELPSGVVASASSRSDPAPLLCGVASIAKRFAYCPVNRGSVNLNELLISTFHLNQGISQAVYQSLEICWNPSS